MISTTAEIAGRMMTIEQAREVAREKLQRVRIGGAAFCKIVWTGTRTWLSHVMFVA
jgi:hypothetical protein